MNAKELDECCDNKTIIDDHHKKFIIKEISVRYIVCMNLSNENLYVMDKNNYKDLTMIDSWEIKKEKKYWLWKFRERKDSPVQIISYFLDDNFKQTDGRSYPCSKKAFHYVEKILLFEHVE